MYVCVFVCREWRRCKYWLLDFFRTCCKAAEKQRIEMESSTAGEGVRRTLFEALIDAVDASSAHQFSLMLLWASQANALPVRQCVFSAPSYSVRVDLRGMVFLGCM